MQHYVKKREKIEEKKKQAENQELLEDDDIDMENLVEGEFSPIEWVELSKSEMNVKTEEVQNESVKLEVKNESLISMKDQPI